MWLQIENHPRCMSNEHLYVTTGIYFWLFLNSEFARSKDSGHLNDANWSNWQYQFPITSTQTVRMNHTKDPKETIILINLKVGTPYQFFWTWKLSEKVPNLISLLIGWWINPATIFVKSRKMALILGGAKAPKSRDLETNKRTEDFQGWCTVMTHFLGEGGGSNNANVWEFWGICP